MLEDKLKIVRAIDPVLNFHVMESQNYLDIKYGFDPNRAYKLSELRDFYGIEAMKGYSVRAIYLLLRVVLGQSKTTPTKYFLRGFEIQHSDSFPIAKNFLEKELQPAIRPDREGSEIEWSKKSRQETGFRAEGTRVKLKILGARYFRFRGDKLVLEGKAPGYNDIPKTYQKEHERLLTELVQRQAFPANSYRFK